MQFMGEEYTEEEFEKAVSEVQKQIAPVVLMIMGMMESFADNDRFTRTQAKLARNLHQAYLDVGFSKEEALQLVLADKKSLSSNNK